jgi:hypothetical protein
MKILLLLVLIPTLVIASESPDSFPGIKWGDSPLGEMVLLDTRGDFTFYKRIEFNTLQYVNVYNPIYGFCKNQLCEVYGQVKGEKDFLVMQQFLLTKYGRPSFYDPYHWFWLNETDIMITYDEKSETGYFLYHYNPMFLEIEKERIEKIKLLKAAKKQKKGK